MPRFSRPLLLLLIVFALAAGCASPKLLAKSLFGRWESGKTVLLLTPHGLYSLFYNAGLQAGKFGVPDGSQILVERSVGVHTLRNLWPVKLVDSNHLSVTLPEGQKLDFTRAAPRPLTDVKLVGLWQRPIGLVHWNFFEFTPEGDYVQIAWTWGRPRGSAPVRLVDLGRATTENDKLHLEGANGAKDFLYSVAGSQMHLQLGKRPATTYRKVTNTRFLER